LAETRPDPDVAVDREAIDRHALKLVAEKARRDAERFEKERRRPLSAAETLAVVLGVAAVIAVAALALIAGR
jgi:type IV secretory pathway component VirB8